MSKCKELDSKLRRITHSKVWSNDENFKELCDEHRK